MREPLITILVPVYNAENYLDDCLTTILNQTLEEIEIICVNDGSTDGSLALLNQYEAKTTKIRVIDQQNQGAGAARNAGLAVAAGEYLSFLDADDFYEPDMLEKSYLAAKKEEADVCVFYADLFDDVTKTYKPCTWAFRREYFRPGEVFDPKKAPNNDYVFQMFNGWAWDKLFRREFILEKNLEYQNLRTTNDMYFVFMALAKADRIVTLDECLIHQRVSVGTSLSRTREKSWNCFYLGLQAMHQEMKACQLDKLYGKSFVNWVVNFSKWQLETMRGMPYCWTYNLLKETAFEEFGVTSALEEEFYNKKEYIWYKNIMEQTVEEVLIGKWNWYLNRDRQLMEKINQLEKEKTEAGKQLEKIKKSKSYRIGRALTKPIRMLKKTGRK